MKIGRNGTGQYVAVEPVEVSSRAKAVAAAQALASGHSGAVAFSRIGDPEAGDFEDAVELSSFGDLPDDLASVFA